MRAFLRRLLRFFARMSRTRPPPYSSLGDAVPTVQEKRDEAVWYAERMLFRWYVWGGDDPLGWDCSGVLVGAYRSVGVLDPEVDLSSNGMYLLFSERGQIVSEPIKGGCVIFLDGAGHAYHIEMFRNEWQTIGAKRGRSGTGQKRKRPQDWDELTRFERLLWEVWERVTRFEGASARNAFIDVLPVETAWYDNPRVVFADPFKE